MEHALDSCANISISLIVIQTQEKKRKRKMQRGSKLNGHTLWKLKNICNLQTYIFIEMASHMYDTIKDIEGLG